MFKKLKQWMDDNRDFGVTVWTAYDPVRQRASVTLFMAYISFILAVISLITLHFKPSLIMATTMAFIFHFVCVVFYLMREINKAKFDLDDKSFSLESDEKKNDN